MIISLRFRYVAAVLAVIVTDRAFHEFLFEQEDDPRLGQYAYFLVAASLALSFLFLKHFSPLMRGWFLLVLLCLAALAMESYVGWGSWLVYPHVFSKLTVMLPAFAVYGFHRRYGLPPFGILMSLVLVGLLTNLFLLHPDALSLSAFLDNERGFSVESAFLLLLLALYFLNQYLAHGGILRLVLFFALLGLILFLQHRTVWIASGVALLLNVFLIRRTAGVGLYSARLVPVVVLPVVLGLLGGTATVINNPAVLQKIEASIDDIANPAKQGTGNWRLQQFQAYEPILYEYPLAGMRLKGFELPIQFYNEDTNAPVWLDGTGHHFHSWYVDRLFYFGILGVLLAVAVPIMLVVKRLRQPLPLEPTTSALIAFCASSLIYGISYDWPAYLYAVYGLMLAAAAPLPAWAVAPPPRPLPKPVPEPEVSAVQPVAHATI